MRPARRGRQNSKFQKATLATRCLKLNTIIKGVVKRDSLDEDRELSRLQNFILDTAGPLVAAFCYVRMCVKTMRVFVPRFRESLLVSLPFKVHPAGSFCRAVVP